MKSREQLSPHAKAPEKLTRRIGFDGKMKLYNSRGLLDPSSYTDHILASLKNNPELDVSRADGKIIEEYLNQQSPEYRAELQKLIENAPPLSPTTELSIAIPAYREGKNIYNTLSWYATMPNHSEFEVVILENHPNTVARDDTAANITRFQKEHPDVHVIHLYKTFEEKHIGGVRKYLTDAILERKRASGRDDSILIASNDADLEGINPRYAKILIEKFESDPNIDAIRGGTDHSIESFTHFPLMHATIRFLNYFRMIQRRMQGGPMLNGRNSAMRSGIYAAIGGYNEHALVGEDIEIGKLILHGRKNKPNCMRYVHNAWIHSNARREIESLLSGVPIIHRYQGFVSNENVYDFAKEKLASENRDFSPEQFALEIQAIYTHYKGRTVGSGGWLANEVFEEAFDRAMRFMSIRYHTKNDVVVIDDMSKLVADLERYAERNERAA